MDNPRHRHMRKLTSWAYTQSSMRSIAKHFDELALSFTEEFIQDLENSNGSGDLVSGLACKLPLAAVGELMGLAPDDWKQILIWSNAVLG